MNEAIRNRLLAAEDDFLSAISEGVEAIQTTDHQWKALIQDCEIHMDELDEATVVLAHATSSRIAILADGFYNTEMRAASLGSVGLKEIDAILESLNGDLFDDGSQSTFERDSLFRTSPSEWLLRNLHNPYPPPALKAAMEPITTKSISEWFTRARQRIGWSRLMRDHFGGSRTAAVDAAFQAYVRDDPNNPLDPELLAEFVALKANAEQKLSRMTVEVDYNGGFLTGERSRSVSPVPSLTFSSNADDSEDEIPTYIVPRLARKRSMSWPSENTTSVTEISDEERPLKRLRSHSASTFKTPRTPSTPAASNDDLLATAVHHTTRSQKHRLSRVRADQTFKWPQGLEGPRQHSVSDPFPAVQSGLEDWFGAFNSPSRTTGARDLQSLGLDLFNVMLSPEEYSGILAETSASNNSHPSCSNLNSSMTNNFGYSSLLPSPSAAPEPDEFNLDEYFNLDSISDTSFLAPSSTFSSSPHLDIPTLSPEFSFNIPSLYTIPPNSVVPPSKSADELNPMLQAFSDFFSTSFDPAVPGSDTIDGRLADALAVCQGDSIITQNWPTL